MTEAEREKILDRLAKLFALAERNPNANEAKAALMMAQRIMAENAIAEDDVRYAGERSAVREEIGSSVGSPDDDRRNLSSVASWLGQVIGDHFRVKMWIRGPRVMFTGYESHRKVATSVYRFALRAMESGAASWVGAWKALTNETITANRTRAERQSWLYGFVRGIKEGFEEQLRANPQWLAHTKIPADVVIYVETELKLKSGRTGSVNINGTGGAHGYKTGKDFAASTGGSARDSVRGLLK